MMKRALIVIDVQNEYVSGKLPISSSPVHESLMRIGEAIDAANAHSIFVVLIQQVAPEGSPIFDARSSGADIHDVAKRRPYDVVMTKTFPNAFAKTDLDRWLRDRAIDTVTLVGYMTHNCIDSTARAAFDLGYVVEVLSDATGTLAYSNAAGSVSASDMHTAFLAALHARFASVMTTRAWITAVESNAQVVRGDVLASATAGMLGYLETRS